MKVLFCTAESTPFAATGGLGDVSGSLPQSLRQRLVGCRVVMPLYDDIPDEYKENMEFVTSFTVPVGWRNQYCGVFESQYNGVIYYFIDNQYYFKRHGLYGHYDDAERFIYFSRAVIEMLPQINFKPNIIHCNDWQTAAIPLFMNVCCEGNDFYKDIKTLFTIHNIGYQGKYGIELTHDLLGLPDDKISLVEYDGFMNLLKGGIECADWVNTVSPTYAEEILTPWFSHGMHNILRERSWKLSGILNGIDDKSFDPENDPDIYAPFSADNLEGKYINKNKLQERLGLEQDPDAPLIGMVTRMVSHKGLDLVTETINKLMWQTDAQFVILGNGEWDYECFFREMQERYPGRFCSCFGFVPELSRKIYAGADIFLMPSKSEPCGLSQMMALRYGTIPVVRETGGLKDSIQDSGDHKGNGFTFQRYNSGDMFYAVLRAIEGFADDEGWEILVKRAMNCDNSWGRSAKEYMALYKQICGEDTTECEPEEKAEQPAEAEKDKPKEKKSSKKAKKQMSQKEKDFEEICEMICEILREDSPKDEPEK